MPDQPAAPDPHFDAPDVATTRLHGRAIRERWPMSVPVRVKVLKRLCQIVDEDSAWPDRVERPNHREVIAAARALISADRLNLEQQRIDLVAGQGDGEMPDGIDPAAASRALEAIINGPEAPGDPGRDPRDAPG